MAFNRVGSTGSFEGYDRRPAPVRTSVKNEYSSTFEQESVYSGFALENLESDIEEQNGHIANDVGYFSMTPEQAVKQAQTKLASYGIQTKFGEHYYEGEEDESGSQSGLVAELIEALTTDSYPEKDFYMECQKLKMEEARYKIKNEGFFVGSKK